MAKADLGIKRTCKACGMRFYDLNRSPITCPGCKEEFNPEAVIAPRKGRSSAKAAAVEDAAVTETEADMVNDTASDIDDDDVTEDLQADAGINFDDGQSEDDEAGILQDEIEDDEALLEEVSNEEDS